MRRNGFTLVEIVIALGIIGLLSAVLVPQVLQRLDESESAAMLGSLNGLVEGIAGYRNDVGRYPSNLVLLSTAPVVSSTDICSLTMPGYIDWQGPYLSRPFTASGLNVGSATISNVVTRDPISTSMTTAVASLVITATGVEQHVADAVEAHYDGNANFTTGNVRWSVTANTPGRGGLTLRLPIRGC